MLLVIWMKSIFNEQDIAPIAIRTWSTGLGIVPSTVPGAQHLARSPPIDYPHAILNSGCQSTGVGWHVKKDCSVWASQWSEKSLVACECHSSAPQMWSVHPTSLETQCTCKRVVYSNCWHYLVLILSTSSIRTLSSEYDWWVSQNEDQIGQSTINHRAVNGKMFLAFVSLFGQVCLNRLLWFYELMVVLKKPLWGTPPQKKVCKLAKKSTLLQYIIYVSFRLNFSLIFKQKYFGMNLHSLSDSWYSCLRCIDPRVSHEFSTRCSSYWQWTSNHRVGTSNIFVVSLDMASSLPAVLDGVPLAAPSPLEDETQSGGQPGTRKRKNPPSDTPSKGPGRARRGAAKTLSSSFRTWHLMPETHYTFWHVFSSIFGSDLMSGNNMIINICCIVMVFFDKYGTPTILQNEHGSWNTKDTHLIDIMEAVESDKCKRALLEEHDSKIIRMAFYGMFRKPMTSPVDVLLG